LLINISASTDIMSYLLFFLFICVGTRFGMSTTTTDWLENNVNVWGSDGSFDMKQSRCNKRKLYSRQNSYTVWYKAGQIREHVFHAHLSSIKALHGPFSNKVFWHPEFLSGYILPGDISNELLVTVRSFPGIHSVGRTKVYRNSITVPVERNLAQSGLPPWGLDRISHKKLPLHHNYTTSYSGVGSNVFIVDTGIDTEHSQFRKGKFERNVLNIYDGSDPSRTVHPLNNDNEGHGTHVAGTVGGNDVGVSPGANIYGVKVLGDDYLEGSDMDIVQGLNFVRNWYLTHNKAPSVVSMSLGRNCESLEQCQDDILVKAVEVLTSTGIVVVVAAGNDECDSCFSSPAFASSAITVGASSETDDAAVFSDYGKCIDVYAPGVNIISACGHALCPGFLDKTTRLNGTSMACPHVSGVVAQLLQAYPLSTVSEITNKLICDTSKMVLRIQMDRTPAVTRNLLLQVPTEAPVDEKRPIGKPLPCELGAGCEKFNKCSGNGYCQRGHCLCDGLAWGSNCSVVDIKDHCDPVRK
jgi:Subtilase family